MVLDDLRRVVDILAGKGVALLNYGGGEPLLVPDLMGITDYAVSRGLKVAMNSNGWLLDEAMADRISRAGFYGVGISIDSPCPIRHDRFRNKEGSFERALRALDNLGRAGVRTTVSSVISRINVDNWRGMIELCRDHGAAVLYLHNYKCSGMGFANMKDLDLTPGQWRAFYSEALEVRESLEDLAISFDDPIMAAIPGYRYEGSVPGSTCGKLSLHVGPDGHITPCGFIPLSIGHILEDDFDEIWFRSPVLKAMRSKTPRGKCVGCASYAECLGGCTARVLAVTGTFDEPDPHCWVPGDGPDA